MFNILSTFKKNIKLDLLIKFWQKYQLAIILNSSMILSLWPFYFLVKKTILKLTYKINSTHIEFIKKHNVSKYLLYSIMGFYIIFWFDITNDLSILPKIIFKILFTVSHVYTIIVFSVLLLISTTVIQDIYQTKKISQRIPIGPYTQTLKIIIVLYGITAIIAYVIDIPLSTILASFGAIVAVLTFVFKETIIGLVSSLQLTLQDVVQIGDWITVPSYGTDGKVEKINISTLTIRNFDKTISTIPTQLLLSTGMKNWRGMVESGGRRIKRAILIDLDTIKFCSEGLLDRLKTLNYIEEILKSENVDEITNVKLFRLYITSYLKNSKLINSQKFTFLVRQLAPTEKGLPIELCIFTASTEWIKYENTQSDIFEHSFAILHKFDLRAFQSFAKKINVSN